MDRRDFRSMLCLTGLVLLVLLSGCCGDGGEAVLFEDTFDDPRSGWGEDERDEFERGYDRDEAYYLID